MLQGFGLGLRVLGMTSGIWEFVILTWRVAEGSGIQTASGSVVCFRVSPFAIKRGVGVATCTPCLIKAASAFQIITAPSPNPTKMTRNLKTAVCKLLSFEAGLYGVPCQFGGG